MGLVNASPTCPSLNRIGDEMEANRPRNSPFAGRITRGRFNGSIKSYQALSVYEAKITIVGLFMIERSSSCDHPVNSSDSRFKRKRMNKKIERDEFDHR